jgi:hypothetical protein
MTTHADAETGRVDSRRHSGPYRPAYGPVDALLGYVLFYVVVDRATPTVVSVAGDLFPDVPPGAAGFGLAAFLWFVFAVSTVEQVRRQLAALGVVSHDEVDPDPGTRCPPSEPVALGYLVLFGFAAGIALLTFERGIAVAISLVPAVATLDVGSLLLVDLLVMVLFFAAWAATTWSLDRLVVGGVRWALGD